MADEVCHEFVDTGRCGHSDTEHDALTDAPDSVPTVREAKSETEEECSG